MDNATVATKLLTIAKDQRNVYNAGYVAGASKVNEGYATGYQDGAKLKDMSPYINTEEMTNFSHFFNTNTNLSLLEKINTINAIDCSAMFMNCNDIIKGITLNIPNATNLKSIFSGCQNIPEIAIEAYSATTLYEAFQNCKKITKINIDTHESLDCRNMFLACDNLKQINTPATPLDLSKSTLNGGMFSYCNKLEEVYFAQNSIRVSISFKSCTSLTSNSLQSIINGLYDYSKSTTPTTAVVTFPTNWYTNVLTQAQREQISNKGWSVST